MGSGGGGNHTLNLFTWAEYHSQDLLDKFGKVTVTVYNSNEEAIAKLQAAGGTSGFDLIVPTGVYIPQMAADGLIADARQDAAHELREPRPDLPRPDVGPRQQLHGPEGLGLDRLDLRQHRHHDAAQDVERLPRRGDGSGERADVGARHRPEPHAVIYFWANGIDWTTTDTEGARRLRGLHRQHARARTSRRSTRIPGINLTQGNYVLSKVWNGDARQGLLAVDDPDKYTWGLGAPTTELWMDNCAIVKDAPNVDSAYDFIDFMLDPANSVIDLEFHGYNTALKDIESLLPADLQFKDMIFFTPEEVKTMDAGAVNEAQDRLVDIYNKAKAKAGA